MLYSPQLGLDLVARVLCAPLSPRYADAMTQDAVILRAVRTPIGRLQGALGSVPPRSSGRPS